MTLRVPPQNFPKNTRRILWVAFIAALVAVSIAGLLLPADGENNAFFFYPAFGFAASVLLVLLSRLLGFFLKRPDNYWEKR